MARKTKVLRDALISQVMDPLVGPGKVHEWGQAIRAAGKKIQSRGYEMASRRFPISGENYNKRVEGGMKDTQAAKLWRDETWGGKPRVLRKVGGAVEGVWVGTQKAARVMYDTLDEFSPWPRMEGTRGGTRVSMPTLGNAGNAVGMAGMALMVRDMPQNLAAAHESLVRTQSEMGERALRRKKIKMVRTRGA